MLSAKIITLTNSNFVAINTRIDDRSASEFIICITKITDNDIYIEVMYPDGTNKQTFNAISSQDADFFAVGTTLTTDGSSTWTGALSNLYQIDVSTVGDVGADCQPIVKVFVTIPSVTIQIASEFGLN